MPGFSLIKVFIPTTFCWRPTLDWFRWIWGFSLADYIGGWVTGGGCQGDPTLHTTGFYQNSCLLLRQRTEYALQRKVLQCNGHTFVCATVQCAVCSVQCCVGTQDLLSLPAPSLSEGSRAQIGATGGARGSWQRLFFPLPIYSTHHLSYSSDMLLSL